MNLKRYKRIQEKAKRKFTYYGVKKKMDNEWQYYNHALIPSIPPHETVDIKSLADNPLWEDKRVLFARWTSDYDSKYETNWWYCIKDEPFDISSINAKKRYEINKGTKNFDVRIINPIDYKDALFDIYVCVANTYSINMNTDQDSFIKNFERDNVVVFGAFDRSDGVLSGYAIIVEDGYIKYESHKAYPEKEKKAANAAIVNGILEYYNDKLSNEFYICDGERNIYHETRFQDYLEKYFGFRKAYCRLNIKYKPIVKLIVNGLFPFRKFIGNISKLKKVSAVLKMHELYKQKEF